jgi:glycosyltransferase involved in cell wall biosynthesis
MADGPQVAVVQDGARLHYALPAALAARGLLGRVFCDWYSGPGRVDRAIAEAVARVRPTLGRRLLDRFSPDLHGAEIHSRPLWTLRARRRRGRFGSEEAYFAWEARERAKWILRRGFGGAQGLAGFVRNVAPSLLHAAHEAGLVTVVDQLIAPAIIEREEANRQRERFPGWEKGGDCPPAEDAEALAETERMTWAAADGITCASDYVRDGLLRCGVPAARITVAPYPVRAEQFPFVDRSDRSSHDPMVVGCVGAVSLRKGAPYFLQVAEQFDPARVRFVMVGPIKVSPHAAAVLRQRVELAGPVARSEVHNWLRRMDVVLFPSTCEGSATAVLEAMATGLPVVTSPNSGSPVRDGQDGTVLPYDAVDAMAAAVKKLADDRAHRLECGRSAAERARAFTLTAYATGLVKAFSAAGLSV